MKLRLKSFSVEANRNTSHPPFWGDERSRRILELFQRLDTVNMAVKGGLNHDKKSGN
jgi:hypothetical protein